MIQRGFNVAGEAQYALPEACNLLRADRVFITDARQGDLQYCAQFTAERVLWLTRWSDPRGVKEWFKPNGGTQVNLWNEEEWWSRDTDYYFTPELATARLIEQLAWLDEVDAGAVVSVQIGVQWNAVGWAPKFNREEWFAPVWANLPDSCKQRIAMFNVHFYEPEGRTNIGPVRDFLKAVRKWMDAHGARDKKIRLGEIGLDKAFYPTPELRARADSYPERLFRRLDAWNESDGLGIEDVFIYCAGAYPQLHADSQYISLVEFGVPQLTKYGESFKRAVKAGRRAQ